MDCRNQFEIDKKMCLFDGTSNKEKLGANAVLAVSLACARAAAKAQNIPLYRHLGGISAHILPVPMMNILNGGVHADNNLDIQEYMIMPIGAETFSEALRMGSEIYHALQTTLKLLGKTTAIGDEGGFAPDLESDEQAIEVILDAIARAGYKAGKDAVIALDAAASGWYNADVDGYFLPKSKRAFSSMELCSFWESLRNKYPIVSIEDPFHEDDFSTTSALTRKIGKSTNIVGDDLFVTNVKFLKKGIDEKCANAILIKPNQIGTLSETLEAIALAQQNGYSAIMSHRSGETEDTTIADLAVATNCGQIKTGSLSRSERTAKYNRLMKIEDELQGNSLYGLPVEY
jgi:enolase